MVRSEITLARFMRDEVRVSMLEGALKSARSNVIKMEKQLAKVLLSTAVVDDLVGELNGVSDEADELLDEMENLGKTFDRIKMGADIIVKTVKVVAKFTLPR
jgi:predicted transcriptional regulator